MNLTEFLLARIAEDEKWAREAQGDGSGKWASWNRSWDTGVQRDLAVDGVRVAVLPVWLDEHVCRHDPAHVLAECEAKRSVVTDPGFRESGRQTLSIFGERILGHLALPYANHPDYRPEWKP